MRETYRVRFRYDNEHTYCFWTVSNIFDVEIECALRYLYKSFHLLDSRHDIHTSGTKELSLHEETCSLRSRRTFEVHKALKGRRYIIEAMSRMGMYWITRNFPSQPLNLYMKNKHSQIF